MGQHEKIIQQLEMIFNLIILTLVFGLLLLFGLELDQILIYGTIGFVIYTLVLKKRGGLSDK